MQAEQPKIVRPLNLEALTLLKGSHDSPDEGMCVMEAVAFVAGEEHSDYPECASRVIGHFLRNWNDNLDDAGRQMLKPYVLRLVGTAASPEIEERRSWMALDWFIREMTPAWARLAKLTEHADKLEALDPILSTEAATKAQPVIDAAKQASAAAGAAAWDAAGDAAGDAAWDAAGDAAWDAAWDAARAAAWDAARAAARAAAWDAARDAARDALRPTVVELQQSALRLLDRMIAAGIEVGE
jgi:hypothetical protein